MIKIFEQKKSHVAKLISVKIDFWMKRIARNKDKDNFIMTKAKQ